MITYNHKLNMTPGGIPTRCKLGQYDDDWSIVFSLYSAAGDFTLESGTYAMIRGTKRDGLGYSANCTVNISNKTVTVTGHKQITAVAGENIFEIVLYKGTKELSSTNVVFYVERAAMDAGTLVSDSQVQEILDMSEDVIAASDNVSGVRGNFAPAYSTSATYAVGDYVMYSNQMYRCTTAISTAEAWTAAHWTAVSVGGEIVDVKSTLEDLSGLKSDQDYIANCVTSLSGSDIPGWQSGKSINGTTGAYMNSASYSASEKFIKLPEYVNTVTYKTTTYQSFVATYATNSVDGFVERINVATDSRINIDTSIVKYVRISINSTNTLDASTVSLAWDTPLTNYLGNTVFSLPIDNVPAIPDNTDLDTFTAPGNYKVTTASHAASMTNGPVTNAGYRLFVLNGVGGNRYSQIAILNTGYSDTVKIMYRNYTGSWSAWQSFADRSYVDAQITNSSIKAEKLTLTASNYLSYFPNGSFNDAPINTIIGISANVPLTDAPDGDAWIGYGTHTQTGYIRGTLLTFRTNPASDGVLSGLAQILIGHRANSNGYSPTLSYRIAIVSGGTNSWSAWSKFEENGYLHSGNRVISAGRMGESVSDLDLLPPNVIYQIDKNCDGSDAEHTLLNHPCPGISCIVSNIAFSYSTKHGMAQTVYALNGDMYWRYGYENATDDYRWTTWKRIATYIPDPPTNDGTYVLQCVVSNGRTSYLWTQV